MTKILPFLLVAGGLVVSGCAREVGQGQNAGYWGTTAADNTRMQIAYGDPSQRMRDMSIAFRAATTDTVTFPFDSARLDSGARRALDMQAAWLNANEGVRMAVIGHTDLVGGERYNDRLGLRRARAVVNYLVRKGVARSRLDAIESRGEQEPVVDTDARERRNRRAVTVVAGFERGYVGTGIDGVVAQRIIQNQQSGAQGGITLEASGLTEATAANVGGD